MNCKCTSTVVYVDTTHLLYGIFHVLICTYIHSQQTLGALEKKQTNRGLESQERSFKSIDER